MSKLIQEVRENMIRTGDTTILEEYDQNVKYEYDDGRQDYMGDFADYHGGERE